MRGDMQKTEINCDYCGTDLTYSRGVYDYALCLKNRRLVVEGSCVIDYFSYPPIEHDCDFCGIGCLEKWVKNKIQSKENI